MNKVKAVATWIKERFRRLPNHTKAGINSLWQTFVFTLIPQFFGFFDDLKEWASDMNGREFPDASILGKTLASASGALAVGVGTLLFRRYLKPGPVYDGSPHPPATPHPDPPLND